jgi:hypothetical protein
MPSSLRGMTGTGRSTLSDITEVAEEDEALRLAHEAALRSSFGSGVAQAAASMAAGGQAHDALEAELRGDRRTASTLRGQVAALQQEAAQYAPRVSSYKDVRSLGDAGSYAAQALGQAGVTTAPALVAALAARARVYPTLSATAGAAVPAYLMERNEAISSQYQDPRLAALSPERRLELAQTKGGVNALLEAAMPGQLVGRLGRVGASPLRTVGSSMLTEGATELGQEYVGHLAEETGRQGSLEQALGAPLPGDRLIDAGLQGAIGGGGLSLPTAASQLVANKADEGVTAVQDRAARFQEIYQQTLAESQIPGAARRGYAAIKAEIPGLAAHLDLNRPDEWAAKAREFFGEAKEKSAGLVNQAKNTTPEDVARSTGEALGRARDAVQDYGRRFQEHQAAGKNPLQSAIDALEGERSIGEDAKSLELGDQDPSLVGATPEETMANMEKRQAELPSLTERFKARIQADYPELVGGDDSSLLSRARAYDYKGKAQGLLDALKRGFEGGETKKNLMEDIPGHVRMDLERAVYAGLDPDLRDDPQIRKMLPKLATKLGALAARTGPLEASDLQRSGELNEALGELFADPAAVAEQISTLVGQKINHFGKVTSVPSATDDVRRPNSFLAMSVDPAIVQAGVSLKTLARLVDTAARSTKELDAESLKAMSVAFGGKANWEKVRNYYAAKAADHYGVEVQPLEHEEEGQNLSEVEEETSQYRFKSAGKNKIPYASRAEAQKAVDKLVKERRLEQESVKEGERASDKARIRTIGYGEYVVEQGEDPQARLDNKIKNAERRRDAAVKKGKELKAQGADDKALEYERAKIRAANKEIKHLSTKDVDPKQLLDELYSVIKVSAVNKETEIDDNDIHQMGDILRQRSTDPERLKQNQATKLSFKSPDGRVVNLSAEGIAHVMKGRMDPVGGEETPVQKHHRAFAQGVAALLERGYTLEEGQDLKQVLVSRSRGEMAERTIRPGSQKISRYDPGRDQGYEAYVAKRVKQARSTGEQLELVDGMEQYAQQLQGELDNLKLKKAEFNERLARLRHTKDAADELLREIFPLPEKQDVDMASGDEAAEQAVQDQLNDALHFQGQLGHEYGDALVAEKLLKDFDRLIESLEEVDVRRYEEDTGLPIGVERRAPEQPKTEKKVAEPEREMSPHEFHDRQRDSTVGERAQRETKFEESRAFGYAGRTRANASADITIAIASDFNSAGERLTHKAVIEQKKVYAPLEYRGQKATDKAVAYLVEKLNSVGKPSISLNVAGNGIYTLKNLGNQAAVDAYTLDLFERVIKHPDLKTTIASIRSGGQTGFDEAGIKAGRALGIPTTVLAPKGWRFRTVDGQDHEDEAAFKARFEEKGKTESDAALTGIDILMGRMAYRNATQEEILEELQGIAGTLHKASPEEVAAMRKLTSTPDGQLKLLKRIEAAESQATVRALARAALVAAPDKVGLAKHIAFRMAVIKGRTAAAQVSKDASRPMLAVRDHGRLDRVLDTIAGASSVAEAAERLVTTRGVLELSSNQLEMLKLFSKSAVLKGIPINHPQFDHVPGPAMAFDTRNGVRSMVYKDSDGARMADVFFDAIDIFIHEATHGLTQAGEANDAATRKDLEKLVKHVREQMNAKGMNTGDVYALQNTQEFLAEAFSNPVFQKILTDIPALNTKAFANAWEEFKGFVARVLGLKDGVTPSALEEAITLGFKLGVEGKKNPTKFNSQGFTQGTTADQATQDRVLAEIARIRGAEVKAAFDSLTSIGGSGSYTYDKDTGARLIKIALTASNPMQVAWHESLHDLFQILTQKGSKAATRMAKDLLAVASSAPVRMQLKKLLADHPKAWEQVETDPEEALAYMFQFAAAGQLRVGPLAQDWFSKIKRFINKILKTVSQDDRAMAYLGAFSRGELTTSPAVQAMAEAVYANTSTVGEKIRALTGPLGELSDKLMDSSIQRLHDTNIKAFAEVADLHYTPPDRKQNPDLPPYVQRLALTGGVWRNKAFQILEGYSPEQMKESLTRLQSQKTSGTGLDKAITDLLDRVFNYMDSAGVKHVRYNDKGERTLERISKIDGVYFPRVWDEEIIRERRDEFVARLAGIGVAHPETVASHILGESKPGPKDETFTPWNQALEDRVLVEITPANADQFTEFQKQDLTEVLTTYISQAVHRAEYARSFGNAGEVLEAKFEEAKQQGATSKDLATAKLAVQGMHGTLGSELSPSVRQIMTGVITFENLILLPLALMSQVVDTMAIGARSNSFKDTLTALDAGFKAVARSFTKNADVITKDERLAMDLGIIDETAMLEAMGMVYSGMYMSQRVKNINRKFFRFNRMEQWNRAMRVHAMVVGERFILANKDNKRYMDELGLEASDVVETADGRLDTSSKEVRRALFRFVDTAVLRPNAAHRPIWGNDPRFMLLIHLKQFAYSFQNVIVRNMRKEMEHGNFKPLLVLLTAIPAIMISDMMRAAMTGDLQQTTSFGDALARGISRSGLLGTRVFYTDAYEDLGRGQLPGQSFLGPSVEHALTVTKGLLGIEGINAVANRSVPGLKFVN